MQFQKDGEKLPESELAIVRLLLNSDCKMIQRDGLIAAQSDGTIWLLEFDGIETTEDFEKVCIKGSSLWRRRTDEIVDD